jgi:hypothetical protein
VRRAPHYGELHLSLTTAIAVVYADIMGVPPPATETVDAWNAKMHVVARAISRACPIFSTTEDGRLLRISLFDLSEGVFNHGGAKLRLPNGTVYCRLSVRRDDVLSAVDALKKAGVKF